MTDDFELPPMDDETARIVAEARKLPPLTPSRDLWPDIEARLGPQGAAAPAPAVQPRSSRPALRLVRWTSHPAVRLAAAASILVAVTAGVTWRIAQRPDAVTTANTPTAAPTTTATPGTLRRVSLDETVATMDQEILQLEDLLKSRRTLLDPRTVQALETNLALIDRAIAESRAALAADPASRFLATQYTRAYTTKLTLLRDAATLPTGI